MSSLTGTYNIELRSVTSLAIHGSPYFDISFRVEGQEQPLTMRINPEAFYPNPQAGDWVEVTMMMGNILNAQKRAH